ncbi:PREDICTED: inositol 1,4,5-trisphosphate receptor-interacting protein-like 1 [Pseudopodoces humilis]|uniref:inositol 1,4,5-trisphosphate receptor-interacting protein-like 1 n=1 Tax=Pseudopodoces humilis TaxID=181119 RepID=UPI0006B7EE83|nr:PREDICTED: inositol 1,4,5-trisphosphate receptor-interacting protein-like 1 [Pseudopodoces humilis]
MLLKSVTLYPQPVGDWDEEDRRKMELRAQQLEQERLLLEQDVERLIRKSEAQQYLQLVTVAVLLVLVLVLWFMGWERSLRREENEEGNNGANEEGVRNGAANGEEAVGNEEDNANQEEGNDDGNVQEFEGWSPREQDVVYRVLVPMTPPRGHSFHLELDTAGQRQVRNFRVRVQLECTCTREQQGENMLCFLHHPEEELRRNQDPSLLDTLCTGSYLDVQKTARWFHQLVRAIWPALPQSHNWHLTLLPSRRSCQFKVTNGEESFRIEMWFGVRRDDSDIFVSSQPREAHTPRTTWPETYAVAETQFFKLIASEAPPGSLHLKCLQFFTRFRLGFCFSTYAIKLIRILERPWYSLSFEMEM